MKNTITVIVLGNKQKKQNINYNDNLKITYYNTKEKLTKFIEKIDSKYIAFINYDDTLSENYFEIISNKIEEDFDCCYINNSYTNSNKKVVKDRNTLIINLPQVDEYIWKYIYKKESFLKLIQCETRELFNKTAIYLFVKKEVITDVIYYHETNGKEGKISLLCTRKEKKKYDNIIYMTDFLNYKFNGYITWLLNLGKIHHKEYKMTIMYIKIDEEIYDKLKQYFILEKYDNNILYECKTIICVMNAAIYPHNINPTEKSILTIHCNADDIVSNEQMNKDLDIFDKYITVSKTSLEKAKGYYPNDRLEYILNPIVIDKKEKKKHLRLVSAQRAVSAKGFNNIERFANILNYLNIPFTWTIFTDSEMQSKDGLYYRKGITDISDYIEDAHYVVLLSISEAYGYIITEALTKQTKVIVCSLDIWDELGIKDKESGYIIPTEYFEDSNYYKLVDKIKEIYEDKDKELIYDINNLNSKNYNEILSK